MRGSSLVGVLAPWLDGVGFFFSHISLSSLSSLRSSFCMCVGCLFFEPYFATVYHESVSFFCVCSPPVSLIYVWSAVRHVN